MMQPPWEYVKWKEIQILQFKYDLSQIAEYLALHTSTL